MPLQQGSPSVVLILPVLDEEDRIAEVIRRVQRPPVDEILVVDDGSRDASAGRARAAGAVVLSLPATVGVGAALRAGLEWSRERGFEVACIAAGNNKDAPDELGSLIGKLRGGSISSKDRATSLGDATAGCLAIGRSQRGSIRFSFRSRCDAGPPTRRTDFGPSASNSSTIRRFASGRNGSTATSSNRTSISRRTASATGSARFR